MVIATTFDILQKTHTTSEAVWENSMATGGEVEHMY